MNLDQVLQWQYPDTDPTNWTTEYNAAREREVITWWNPSTAIPQPTEAQIDSWYLPAARYYKRREMRRKADAEYRALFDVDGNFQEIERDRLVRKEARVLTGQATFTPGEQEKIGNMNALTSKLTAKLQDVQDPAKTTVAAVEAVTW